MSKHGWWNMTCWNGLSDAQQQRLIRVGNLPMGYVPEGECTNGAEVAIECEIDEVSGPRFYCAPCGVWRLQEVMSESKKARVRGASR